MLLKNPDSSAVVGIYSCFSRKKKKIISDIKRVGVKIVLLLPSKVCNNKNSKEKHLTICLCSKYSCQVFFDYYSAVP